MKHNMNYIFNKIIIIGLGLIGGSLAMAIRQKNLAKEILAYNRSKSPINFAIKNQIIDGEFNFDQDLNKDDLIIIATPLLAYEEIFQKIRENNYQTLITDIGSIKLYPEELYQKIFHDNNNFIPAHPIAGKESSGIENAAADLFFDKKLILTKFCQNHKNIQKITNFWQEIGSEITILDAKNHDKIFCLVSHLPQYISFKFKAKRQKNLPEILQKHLRIENSNSEIWQEIFALNQENLDQYYQIFQKNYQKLNSNPSKREQKLLEQFWQKLNLSKEYRDLAIQRLKIVMAFLQIKDLSDYQEFAGSGFKDFTEILN